MQTEPKRGLGRSPNGGLGGQSPPTKKPSDNYVPVQLLRSLHVYAISEVNAYTPVLVYDKLKNAVNQKYHIYYLLTLLFLLTSIGPFDGRRG